MLTVKQAEQFFAQSGRFRPIKPPTDKVAGYQSKGGRQVALLRGNSKVTLFMSDGEWLNAAPLLTDVDRYSPQRPRNSNLAANAPMLRVGYPIVKVVVSTQAALEQLCTAYEGTHIPSETKVERVMMEAQPAVVDSVPLNQILFGPPGTGKTYHCINKALAILDPAWLAAHEADRPALKVRFDELVREGRIDFVTFHQSFSYEDFVEGIRAESDEESGQLRYEVVDGVFKRLCGAAARITFSPGQVFGRDYQVVRASADLLELKKPNGNRLGLALNLLQTLAEAVRTGQITVQEIREKTAIDKLPNTGLEPFLVNGYNNILAPLVEHLVSVVGAAHEAEPCSDARVLIIDEINRGNVSRIFGELITLIEPSKRAGAAEALSTTLPYSRQPFSVPDNLYLIGTMNTADRSLAGLDIALRRRFVFEEMPPRPDLLDEVEIEENGSSVNIGALLRVMNQRIELLLDRDHCLGHAYFMPLNNKPTLKRLSAIFQNQILPLLQEYFFEDWQRIAWVLNDHRKGAAEQFLQAPQTDVQALFGDQVKVGIHQQRWKLNESAFKRVGAYSGIIKASQESSDESVLEAEKASA